MHAFSRQDFLDLVVWSDPAGPKKTSGRQAELKRVKARMAIVAAGLTPLGHIVILDAWAERASTIKFVDQLYIFWNRWHPSRLGIEEAAQQGLFIEAFDYITRITKGQTLPIVGIPVPNNQEKDYRIRTSLQPLMSEGRLIVNPSHIELVSEIRNFPRSPLRDLLDCIAGAVKMLPLFRGQTTTQPRHEAAQYIAYLQASGAPPATIHAAQIKLAPHLAPTRDTYFSAKYPQPQAAHA